MRKIMMETGKKKETHTIERHEGIEEEEEETDNNDQNLYQILKNLEQEWDFIKKKPEETLYRSSTSSTKMIKALGLQENSPRKLMSSLQHRIASPPPSDQEVAWKVRTNDLAVEEILHERRAAIAGGKLKGRRRLLEELEGAIMSSDDQQELEELDGFSYDYSDNNYEEENCGRKEALLYLSCPHCSCSCSCSSSSSPSSSSSQGAENIEESRGGLEVAIMAEKTTNINVSCDVVGSGGGRGKGKGKAWVFISFVAVCIVGTIISRNCFGMYEDEEVILTPT